MCSFCAAGMKPCGVFHAGHEEYRLNDINNSVIDEFIAALDDAEFMPTENAPLGGLLGKDYGGFYRRRYT